MGPAVSLSPRPSMLETPAPEGPGATTRSHQAVAELLVRRSTQTRPDSVLIEVMGCTRPQIYNDYLKPILKAAAEDLRIVKPRFDDVERSVPLDAEGRELSPADLGRGVAPADWKHLVRLREGF